MINNSETKTSVNLKNSEVIFSEEHEEFQKFAEIGKVSCELLHDLINPIAGLILYLELAKDHEPKRELLENFLAPINDSSSTIRDFIKLIQKNLDHGAKTQIIKVENVIQDSIQILKCKALKNNVSFVFAQNTVRTLIIGNSMKIYQVIINLISNAIDAFENISDERRKKINITIEETGKELLIKINDNGIGIQKEKIKEIFNGHKSGKTNGLGIGLSHTKQILENHFDSKISVNSKENSFTKFTISFPKKRRAL